MVKKNEDEGKLPLANQTPATTAGQLKKFQEDTVNAVLLQVKSMDEKGGLHLPPDYSPGNALKSAWLMLLESKDKQGVPVLEACSKESICNALLNMTVQGLNPMKKQCAFIAYGGKLTMQTEYHGNIALARRFGNVKHVRANCIYEGDVFEYAKDAETGLNKIIKHEQKMENIDINKIRGAYAHIIQEDGTVHIEIMTMVQIRSAWNMGHGGDATKAHKQFTDQMAAKTVINRGCKLFISTSSDGGLVEGREYNETVHEEKKETVAIKGNKTELDIQDAEEVKETPVPKEEPTPAPAAKGSTEHEEAPY